MILFQLLNEHTRINDSSGREMRVIQVFTLAFQFILNDFVRSILQNKFLAELMRKMLVLPSAWNEKTQLFLKNAAAEVTWK